MVEKRTGGRGEGRAIIIIEKARLPRPLPNCSLTMARAERQRGGG